MKNSRNMSELSAIENATFCGQVALVLKAGIPLYDGMETLTESCEDPKAKVYFKSISDKVKESGSLYQAVSQVGFFPDYMVNMIRIGEETGKLDDVLASLEKYYQREDSTKRSIKNAITYPILLVIMMSAVILLLVTRVLPIFDGIYENLGTDMPDSGRAFMNIGRAFGYASLIVTLLFVVSIVIIYIMYKVSDGYMVRGLMYKFPVIKKLNKKIASGRFASVMSMMLGSGYSIEKALEIAPGIVTDSSAKELIERFAASINQGKSFPESMTQVNLFSGLQTRMINVGYKAGQLDSVMEKMSDIYEKEVEEAIDKLVSFIEPVLVAVLSIIIGGILVSVMLPLASIMSSL